MRDGQRRYSLIANVIPKVENQTKEAKSMQRYGLSGSRKEIQRERESSKE